MQIAILGAGSVGGYFGGRLSQVGAVVRFGQEADVATPQLKFIYRSLLPMELRARGQLQFGE